MGWALNFAGSLVYYGIHKIEEPPVSESYTESLMLARAELRHAQTALNDEIRHYPTPIAGCDVQFNQLLAERRRIGDALRALQGDVFVPTPRTPFAGAGVESR